MVSQQSAPSAVTNTPPEVAPGIPAVEVDPTNELLDGENLDEKRALLEEGHVQVDPSGTRLESVELAKARDAGETVDPNQAPAPPASANLELRRQVNKTNASFLESIGQGPEGPDTHAEALEREKQGLQQRADDGDEKAGRRVKQVDEQLKARKSSAASKRSESAKSESEPRKVEPEGRVQPQPKQTA